MIKVKKIEKGALMNVKQSLTQADFPGSVIRKHRSLVSRDCSGVARIGLGSDMKKHTRRFKGKYTDLILRQ